MRLSCLAIIGLNLFFMPLANGQSTQPKIVVPKANELVKEFNESLNKLEQRYVEKLKEVNKTYEDEISKLRQDIRMKLKQLQDDETKAARLDNAINVRELYRYFEKFDPRKKSRRKKTVALEESVRKKKTVYKTGEIFVGTRTPQGASQGLPFEFGITLVNENDFTGYIERPNDGGFDVERLFAVGKLRGNQIAFEVVGARGQKLSRVRTKYIGNRDGDSIVFEYLGTGGNGRQSKGAAQVKLK